MDVVKDGDFVIISGKGIKFIKLRAALLEVLLEDEVRHLSKGKLSVPNNRFHLVAPILESLSVTYPISLITDVKNYNESLSRHLNAKQTILSYIENSACTTGNAFWDKILDPKQGLAIKCMTTPGLKGMCLFDEQGVGKTVMSISAFDILYSRGDVEALWVICPKNMTGEWPQEFSNFLGDNYSVSVLEGNARQKTEIIQKKTDVLVSNFEGILSHLELLKGIASSRETVLIVDESFYVKNPGARRSRAIADLRSACKMTFCLCGTPAPNKPEDIINQFDIADGGYTFEGFRIPDDEERVVEEVKARIEERGIYLRRLKEELLPDLPGKLFEVHAVDFTGKQALLYQKARDELVLYLRGLDNSRFKKELGTYFQKRSALLQICVDPAAVDPSYDEVPAKFSKLDQLVESIVVRHGKKVVLWSFYKKSLDKLELRYINLGIVRVDGSVSSAAERRKAVSEFQGNPDVRLFLGNPAAAGAGITLHAAAEAVYVSYSNQAAHYLQSLDRIHRRGQIADEVKYHLLVGRDTIEEKEICRLRDKERSQQELLGDRVKWPTSLDDALSELGGAD